MLPALVNVSACLPTWMEACLIWVSRAQHRVGATRSHVGAGGAPKDSRWGMGTRKGQFVGTLQGKVLTSYCGGGSHRTRCSSSGRSGCSAGTRAEGVEAESHAGGLGSLSPTPAGHSLVRPSCLTPPTASPVPQAPTAPPQVLHLDSA